MLYSYKCTNEKCKQFDNLVTINKPMQLASDTENCSSCGKPLQRMYGLQGHSTFSDGWKG